MNNNLDDIIFKERNQEYGAYFLRTHSNKYLIISFLVSIIIAIIFVIFLLLDSISRQNSQYQVVPEIIYIENSNMININDLEKKEKKIIPPSKEKPKEKNEVNNQNFIITDSLQKDSIILVNKINQDIKNNTSTADSISAKQDSLIKKKINSKDIIYYNLDKLPYYFDGIKELRKFVASTIVYPQDAITKNISGTVVIQFNTTETGKIDSVIVNQAVFPALDNEAVRVIKLLPESILFRSDHKNVKIWYILSIKFSKF